MSGQHPYAPPVIYQQGSAYGAPPAPTAAEYDTGAGWMGPPASAAAPYPQQYQQQQQQQGPFPYQQPYQQQPAYQQGPYPSQPQQQPYGQPYPSSTQHPYHQPYPSTGSQQPYQQPYPSSQQPYQQPYPSSQPQQQYDHQQQQQRHHPQPSGPPATLRGPMHSPNPLGPSRGRKKALLIGCAYPGTSNALNGCINDVQCIEYCLKTKFEFPQSGIVMLRDDQKQPDFLSTRANIMRAIQWLLADQRLGDSLFFHFSGHGSQQVDRTGQEADGMNETILPTDHKRAGQIVDDELNLALVRPLQTGVTLHAVIDACHSGTALDLPFRTTTRNGRFDWKAEPPYKGTSGGTCFQFGACKDSQVAQDTKKMSGTAYTGAATYSFIDAVEKFGTKQTYAVLLGHMRDSLNKQGGAAGGLPFSIPSMGGGLAGFGMQLVSNFLLGPAAMGGQTPVMCCDKKVDLYNTTLAI